MRFMREREGTNMSDDVKTFSPTSKYHQSHPHIRSPRGAHAGKQRRCGWTFMDGHPCGDLAMIRTAGGLHLCGDHLTDWSRGVPHGDRRWVDLMTGRVVGGITNGQVLT